MTLSYSAILKDILQKAILNESVNFKKAGYLLICCFPRYSDTGGQLSCAVLLFPAPELWEMLL